MVLNPGMLAISEVPVDYATSGGAGVAVAKGDNEALLEVLNAYIEKITTDGTFDSWVDLAVEQNAKLVAEAEAAAAEATAAPAETGTKTE
jgi:ABC-type amino acid transport substrate-binding protein